jgi:hypothetical protein
VLRDVFAVLTDTLHKVSHCTHLIHSGERDESVSLQWSAVQAHIRLSAVRVLVVVLACVTAYNTQTGFRLQSEILNLLFTRVCRGEVTVPLFDQVRTCPLSYPILSCPVLSCPVLSCPVQQQAQQQMQRMQGNIVD